MSTPPVKKIVALAIVLALNACGKEDASPTKAEPGKKQSPVVEQPKAGNSSEPSVAAAPLDPVFKLPARYASYQLIEASELTRNEISQAPSELIQVYKNEWIKRAGSIAEPDWWFIASSMTPELATTSNEFKKKEIAEKTREQFQKDAGSLKVVFAWKNENSILSAPNVETGDYTLTLAPKDGGNGIYFSLDSSSPEYRYSYEPNFEPVGVIPAPCQGMTCRERSNLVIRVPIEVAKEIETHREKHPDMIRVYGTTSKMDALPPSAGALTGNLIINVEAIEVGTRKNGVFHSYFFLDGDQLGRMRPVPAKKEGTGRFFGI